MQNKLFITVLKAAAKEEDNAINRIMKKSFCVLLFKKKKNAIKYVLRISELQDFFSYLKNSF